MKIKMQVTIGGWGDAPAAIRFLPTRPLSSVPRCRECAFLTKVLDKGKLIQHVMAGGSPNGQFQLFMWWQSVLGQSMPWWQHNNDSVTNNPRGNWTFWCFCQFLTFSATLLASWLAVITVGLSVITTLFPQISAWGAHKIENDIACFTL